jgi:hypothetical protein
MWLVGVLTFSTDHAAKATRQPWWLTTLWQSERLAGHPSMTCNRLLVRPGTGTRTTCQHDISDGFPFLSRLQSQELLRERPNTPPAPKLFVREQIFKAPNSGSKKGRRRMASRQNSYAGQRKSTSPCNSTHLTEQPAVTANARASRERKLPEFRLCLNYDPE